MNASLEELQALLQLAVECVAELRTPPAPYRAISDRVSRPKPPLPTLGPAGFTFPDPAFGSRILRVTDGKDRPGRSYDVASNTHVSAWSADSQRFYVIGPDGPVHYAFDADAFAVHPIGVVPSQCEPTFSRSNPDVFYTVNGRLTRTLRRYASGTFTDLLDVDTLGLPGLLEPRTYIGGILEAAGVVVIWYGGQGQGGHYLVTMITPDGSLTHLNTATRLNCLLHSAGLDLSGRYVALYPNNAKPAQVIFWDLKHDTTAAMTVNAGGHDALGFGDLTNQDGAGGPYDAAQWQYRTMDSLDAPRRLIDPVCTPPEVYLSDHQSWNNRTVDGHEPVISSTYRYGAGIGNPWRALVDEILAVSLDGSIYRFAHHRAKVSGFRSQPLIHVAPNGKAALFSSNWEGSLGPDTNEGGSRNDCFVIELK